MQIVGKVLTNVQSKHVHATRGMGGQPWQNRESTTFKKGRLKKEKVGWAKAEMLCMKINMAVDLHVL